MEPQMIPCPFVVGDRVHELMWCGGYAHFRIDDSGAFVKVEEIAHVQIDVTKSDATVTAVTDTGFTYAYDCPIPIGPARWGATTESGECYPEGYRYWTKVV